MYYGGKQQRKETGCASQRDYNFKLNVLKTGQSWGKFRMVQLRSWKSLNINAFKIISVKWVLLQGNSHVPVFRSRFMGIQACKRIWRTFCVVPSLHRASEMLSNLTKATQLERGQVNDIGFLTLSLLLFLSLLLLIDQ